jgi:hypothetical protein
MNILALDLGTHTGYAYNIGDKFYSGTWSLATAKEITSWGKTRLSRRCDPRVGRLFKKLLDLVGSMDAVVYEDVQFSSSTYQVQLWASLRAAVWLSRWGESGLIIDCVPVATLKKFATGAGNATKEMMCNAVRHRWSDYWNPKGDDNELDAVCIHQWAVVNLGRTKL